MAFIEISPIDKSLQSQLDNAHLTTVPTGQQTISLRYELDNRQLANAQSHPHPNSLHIQTDYSPNSLHLPSRLRSKSHQYNLTHMTIHYSQSHHSRNSPQFKLNTIVTDYFTSLLKWAIPTKPIEVNQFHPFEFFSEFWKGPWEVQN